MMLRTADNANIDHHQLWRQWFILSSVGTFGAGLFSAGDLLRLGVQHHNDQQAAAVRTTARSTPAD